MLRGAPPAAGPTGTVGRARATPELHGAVRSGTVGRGPNRDHWPWTGVTGRGSFASTHAHLGTAGRETTLGIAGRTRAGGAARPGAGNYASSHARLGPFLGSRAASGPEELRDSEWTYTSTHAHLAPPAAGPARGPWAAGGPEELCDSEWPHELCRDEVTVCFQYPALEVTGDHPFYLTILVV